MTRNSRKPFLRTVFAVLSAASPLMAASAETGKIPITTKSEEARKEFLTGRDLVDRAQAQSALEHLDKAIALDPGFASAELVRATVARTTKEFFEHLNKAEALAERASEGERLLILETQAGVNSDTTKQKEYLDKLIALYPNDERVHFNLGTYYYGLQQWDPAVEELEKTVDLAPEYSGAYNMLGYAYREKGEYAKAEPVFKKYAELLPNDPNPYDSYGELLLTMGRFDDSIVQYRKALSVDPHFAASRFGIASDLTYSGKHDEAEAELRKMAANARDDGEARFALFGMAVVACDAGKLKTALEDLDKEYAIAAKKQDTLSMSQDLRAKGRVLVEMAQYDEARKQFDRSLELVENSNLSKEVKDNSKLMHAYHLAGLEVSANNLKDAEARAEELRQAAEKLQNPAQIRLSHELAGRIAFAEKKYDNAIAELSKGDLQDAYNLYRLAQAYEAKGDTAAAQEKYKKLASLNSLLQFNYAFVRAKTAQLTATK